MSFFLAVSVVLRLAATAWSIVLVKRARRLALLALPFMLGVMTARQGYVVITGAAAAGDWSLTPVGSRGELLALIVSSMALLAVIVLGGMVERSKPTVQDPPTTTLAPRARAPIAVVIGAIAVIGCISIGVLAYMESRERSMDDIAANNLHLARTIDHVFDMHVDDLGAAEETRADALIARIWDQLERPNEGSFLCVVGSSGLLEFHSTRPDMIGALTANQPLDSGERGTATTVGALLEAAEDWSGRNTNIRGISQLVGYAYSKSLDGLIVVHTPAALVESEIQTTALPWLIALALLAGVLIPVSLGLLQRNYTIAQRSLIAASSDLRENESQLRLQAQLLSSVHESVVAVDMDGKVIYWSNGAEALYGRTAEEAIGQVITFIVSPLEEKEERQRWQQVQDTGSWSGQYIQRRRDGTTFWADTFISLVRDSDGEPCGYIGIDRDITARKVVQEALQHTTSQLAVMLDSMPVITYTRHAGGDFDATFVSRNAEDLTGYPIDSFTNDPSFWIDRIDPADLPGVRAKLSRILDTDELECEYRWRVSDGTYRWFHDAIRVVRNADGAPSHQVGVLQDITERKRSEESLRESEGRFRQLTEHIRDVFWLIEWPSGKTVYVSPTYETLWGRSAESLYEDGASWADLIHVEDRDRVIEAFGRDAERGAYDIEFRIVRDDGSIRWVHDRAFPIRDVDGAVCRFAGIAEDITERKQADEEMMQLHIAIENAMTGISKLDETGCFVEVRKAYAEMLGYTPAQMIGMKWEPTVLPEDRPAAAATYGRMLEDGKAEDEVRAVRRDGSVFIKHILLVRSSDQDGRFDGHYCFMRDVTERKQAADREVESQARFRAIFESEPECVQLLDPSGCVLDMNPAGLAMMEADSLDQVLGECVHPVIVAEYREEFIESTRAVFRGDTRLLTFEFDSLRGNRRWLESHMVPLRSADGSVCALLAVSRDITDRRRAADEIERTAELERLLFRELDHRVRNNLSSLVTLIDITGANARDTKSFADAIRGRVQAMAAAHGLLTQSKWSNSSLRDLVNSLIPSSARGALDLSGDDVLVPAHQTSSLGMVLHELFTNSVKYGALGSEGARISLSCRMEKGPEADETVSMHWKESGGPIVEAKPTPGVGTSLIEGLVRNDLRGEVSLRYDTEGVDHRFTIVLAKDDSIEPDRSSKLLTVDAGT